VKDYHGGDLSPHSIACGSPRMTGKVASIIVSIGGRV
ncbi:MAG: hypothetical protein V7641_4452, partial [Blastocatellia bacterium]